MTHFCADFPIWLKVPKMRQYFVFFCAIWRSYKVVTVVTKDLQKKVKLVTTPEKRIGRAPTILYIHIYLYIHIKELQKELRQGAASELRLDINWSCIGAALPLWELRFTVVELQKFRLQKFHIFFFLIKNHIFKKR